MYKIFDLYNAYNIDKNSKYGLDEIKSFFEINKKVLFLEGEELEKEFAGNWTHDKFVKLLEYVYVLNKNDIVFNKTLLSHDKKEKELYSIRENIFNKNSFEELYNKFIIPKSILEKDIDYGYSETNKKYIANLTSSITGYKGYNSCIKRCFGI